MDTKLDTKIILEKEFKKGVRGYNVQEVDLFLDDIIQDYQSFKTKISELEAEITQLTEQLDEAKKRPVTPPNTGSTNFDILKRISNLEKHVFGSKLQDQE